jgi:glycopeptide antibiotics resistance protein
MKVTDNLSSQASYFWPFPSSQTPVSVCHPSLLQVVDEYHVTKLDVRLYMAVLLLPLILINWVRNLKYLAPFSTLANVLTFIGFGITLYYIFIDIPHISTRNPVGTLRDFPLFFGIVLFALEAIGVVCSDNARHKYTGVLSHNYQ